MGTFNKRLGLYLSSNDKENGLKSIVNQEMILRLFCEGYKIEVCGVYKEAIGYDVQLEKRPAFQSLLTDLQMNKLDGVLVTDLGKISSDLDVINKLVRKDLGELGKSLHLPIPPFSFSAGDRNSLLWLTMYEAIRDYNDAVQRFDVD